MRAYGGEVPGGSGFVDSVDVGAAVMSVSSAAQSVKISRLTVCRYGSETKGVM